jgi:putative ABC transport system permease protein
VFLLLGANCAVLTATLMDGKGVDAMQTAGQAGIWAAIGLALLAPELPRLVTAVLLFTGIATGTVYMQGIEDRVLGGTVASMFTVLPFGSARADRLWPETKPTAYESSWPSPWR